MDNVLITGAGGFIGEFLCRRLDAAGIAYTALKRSGCESGAACCRSIVADWPDELRTLDLSEFSTLVHLALAPVRQTDPYELVHRNNVVPLENLISAASNSNPNCTIVFLSSQSAKPTSDSAYGIMKWKCEELLRHSNLPWVIIKPGLIYGASEQGLFQRISKVIDRFPIIPLIGQGKQLVQPVPVEFLAEVIVRVLEKRSQHRGKTIPVAGEPIEFRDFIRFLIAAKRKHRLLLPLPEFVIAAALMAAERLMKSPGLTLSNLKGLLGAELLDTNVLRREIGISCPPFRRTPEPAETAHNQCAGMKEEILPDMFDATSDLQNAYLDLLKKALTDSLHQRSYTAVLKPGGAVEMISADEEEQLKRVDGSDWPACGETMIGLKRLDNIQFCMEQVLKDAVPGDFIETGVWRGGATIFMRGLLKARGVKDRCVFAADSFEGLPAPDADKHPADKDDIHSTISFLAVSQADVEANFARYGLLDEQVKFLKGWFKDTLPGVRPHRWAVIRLDGDMYESTMDALANLYDDLSPGGFVIIDDYGCLRPCKQAVDDFREARGIKEPLLEVDWTGRYWRKPLA